MNVFLVLLACIGAFVFYLFKARDTRHPIPKDAKLPPAHPGMTFFGSLFEVLKYGQRIQDFHYDMAQKYGQVYWISTHLKKYIFSASEPELAEHFLSTNFTNYQKSDVFKDGFFDLLGTGIFASDGSLWKDQRRIASHLFKTGNMKTFMFDTFCEHGEILLRLIEDTVQKDQDFNALDFFYRYTLDSIGVIAFGQTLNSLDSTSPVSIAFDQAQNATSKRFRNPLWKLQKLLKIGEEGEMIKSIKILDDFAYNLIKKRRGEKDCENREDILSRYVSSTQESDTQIRDALLNFLIAGRDTTGQTLTWLFYILSQNPEVEKKLLQEIDSVFQGRRPTYENLKEATYLDGVIQETLRLYPPVPIDGKMAIGPDTLPNGMYVPSHSVLIFSPWTMGRCAKFWPEPLSVKPERWTNESANKERHPYLHIPFQGGPRLCLGKRMALLEVSLCAVLILQKYTFQYVGEKPPVPITTITLTVEGGEMKMRATPRDQFDML